MTEPLEVLVRQLKQGDRRAYAEIFRGFYAPLLTYSFRLTGCREASEDIVQSFFCSIWEEWRKLDETKSFTAYLYTSVRNRSLNYLRDNRSVALEDYDKASESNFLLELMEEEVYQELYRAVRLLPERCREIFLLKLEGKSNQEIAACLEITEDTVRSQLRRGRELLYESLSGFISVFLVYFRTFPIGIREC